MTIDLPMTTDECGMLTIKENDTPIYNILLENSYDRFYQELEALSVSNQKACIVCDSNTAELYLPLITEITKKYTREVITFTFEAGEDSKNLETVQNLYEHLIKAQFDRGDLLLALGGGVVGDLTGYAAATYLRGIRFMQIPTTLLAMVDSSIGGKTGVDFHGYKNMVGAFYQPKSVYINLNTVKTLPKRVYYSGFGEGIKYALIGDKHFYEWLKLHTNELLQYDELSLAAMVHRCCYHKQLTVEKDPTEKGDRALLNLGHTLGHAIEKLKDFELLHGECVAIGMVASAFISNQRGYISDKELLDIENMIKAFHLPVRATGLLPEDVLAVSKNDKKMSAGKIKYILMDSICHSVIDSTVTDTELLNAIRYILNIYTQER